MRTLVIIAVLSFSHSLLGQKWERLTQGFNHHMELGQYAEALEEAIKAADYAEKKLDSTEYRTMLSQYYVALAYHKLGDMESAKWFASTAFRLLKPYYTIDPTSANICELYGRIEAGLGYHETAETLLTTARDIKKQLYGVTSYEYIQSLYYMADLEMAREDWGKMAIVADEALAIHEEHYSRNQDYARYANFLGLIYMNNGYNKDAAGWFHKALSAYMEPGQEDSYSFAHASNNLAMIYYYESDFENAALYFERADSVYQLLLQDYSENYMMLLNNLASLYYSWGKEDEARVAYQHLEKYMEMYPDRQDLNYIQGVENTADYYAEVGELPTSEKYYKKAISLRRSVTPVDNEELAGCILLLASLYAEESRPELAVKAAVEAYSILQKESVLGDPNLIWTLSFLGQNLYDAEQYNSSLYYYQLAEKHIEHAEGPVPSEASSVYNNLGALYYEQNRLKEAVISMEKAHELDPDDPVVLINMGRAYFDLENMPMARAMFQKAKMIYGNEYGKDHPDYAEALVKGIVMKAMSGDYSGEMLEEIREVERICLNHNVDTISRLFIDCIRSYRMYYYGIKEYRKALSYGERVLRLVEKGFGRQSEFFAESLLEQAGAYVWLGETENLSQVYKEAFDVASSLDGDRRESLQYVIEWSRLNNYYHLEEYDLARKSMEWAIEREKEQFLEVQNILSVQERAAFSSRLVNLAEYNNFLMLFPEDHSIQSNALNYRLFLMSILMDSERRQQNEMAKSGDSILLEMNEEYLTSVKLNIL